GPSKPTADGVRFWSTVAPNPDDDLLRAVTALEVGLGSRSSVSASLSDVGEQIVPMIFRLAPSVRCPSVLFVSRSTDDFLSIGDVAAKWAMRVAAVPIAGAVH